MLFKSSFEPEKIKTRPHKVASDLQRVFSEILSEDGYYSFSGEVKPKITITGVDVSPCLRHVKIFITDYSCLDRGLVLKYLRNMVKTYRFGMAKMIKLKFVPEISFQYDVTEEKAALIDDIFSKINNKVPEREF